MNNWNEGYVTDIAYTNGWYRQQSPAMMALACTMGGVAMTMPAPDDSIHVLELGCGQGYGAMVLAASNPAWQVTAIDFNPAHVAAARAWATESGLTNVTFLEANLATLAEDAAGRQIPEADFITMHGVWSWVPQAVQNGIVRLVRDKLRAGGAMHISYNALPAWGPAIGMQRIIREAGKRLARRSDRQAEEGLTIVRSLLAAEAAQLDRSPFVKSMIGVLGNADVAYLAHEFMNEQWKPCFMADVAATLSDARLEFASSSQLTENFPTLMLTPAQQKIMNTFDDPIMREMIKDTCVERALRHDVFVRGARRLGNAGRDAALMDIVLGLNIDPDDLPSAVDMPAGKAELNSKFYRPIVQALSQGPMRVRDLLALPEVEGRRDNPAELVGMLVGLDIADVVLRPDAPPSAGAMHFNSVLAKRFAQSESLARPVGLASERAGSGVPATVLDLVIMERVRDGKPDMDALLHLIAPPAEHTDKMREGLDRSLRQRMPILRRAGVF